MNVSSSIMFPISSQSSHEHYHVDAERLRVGVTGILAETANNCITELNYHPGIINELRQENAALNQTVNEQKVVKDNIYRDNLKLVESNQVLGQRCQRLEQHLQDLQQRLKSLETSNVDLTWQLQLEIYKVGRFMKEGQAKEDHIESLLKNGSPSVRQLSEQCMSLQAKWTQALAERDIAQEQVAYLRAQAPHIQFPPFAHPRLTSSQPTRTSRPQSRPQSLNVRQSDLRPSINTPTSPAHSSIPSNGASQIQHQNQQHNLQVCRVSRSQLSYTSQQQPLLDQGSRRHQQHSSLHAENPQVQQMYQYPDAPNTLASSSRPLVNMSAPHVQQMPFYSQFQQNPISQTMISKQQPQPQEMPPRISTGQHLIYCPPTPPLSSHSHRPTDSQTEVVHPAFPLPHYNAPSVSEAPPSESQRMAVAQPPSPPASHNSMSPESSTEEKPVFDLPGELASPSASSSQTEPEAGPSTLKREYRQDSESESQDLKRVKLEQMGPVVSPLQSNEQAGGDHDEGENLEEDEDEDQDEIGPDGLPTLWSCVRQCVVELEEPQNSVRCLFCDARHKEKNRAPPDPFIQPTRELLEEHFTTQHAFVMERMRQGEVS